MGLGGSEVGVLLTNKAWSIAISSNLLLTFPFFDKPSVHFIAILPGEMSKNCII
jgi:hypothetical protein